LTRDRKEIFLNLYNVKLRFVDTAGVNELDESKKSENQNVNDLNELTKNQTRQALLYSDLAFFILDCREGITENDIKLANWINKIKKLQEIKETEELNDKENNLEEKEKVNIYEEYKRKKDSIEIKIPKILLIANKAEDDFFGEIFDKLHKINLGEPVFISAEHGDNMVTFKY